MKNSSGVVLMDLPYPAWRLLMNHLWVDPTISYYFVPRLRHDNSVAVLLLGNGGPTSYKAFPPHATETSGRRLDTEVGVRTRDPSKPSGNEAVSQMRQLGDQAAA